MRITEINPAEYETPPPEFYDEFNPTPEEIAWIMERCMKLICGLCLETIAEKDTIGPWDTYNSGWLCKNPDCNTLWLGAGSSGDAWAARIHNGEWVLAGLLDNDE